MGASLKNPEDVFTPRTIVTRGMFERRNEPDAEGNPGVQDRLVDALREKGGQVLIYGDTGVGKSSLLKYAAEDEKLTSVIVECTTETDYAEVLDSAVRQLMDVREVKIRKTSGAEGSISGEGSIPWFSKLSGSFKTSTGKDTEYSVVEKPIIDVVTDLMTRSGFSLLVLDNFQNVKSENTRELVSQLLERLSDRAGSSNHEIKGVVVGIAEDATSLLGSSRSYLRRTNQIGVPRMPDDEIRALLTRGFGLLKISVPQELMDQFVFYSDGFPYFAHLIGLYIARASARSPQQGRERVVSEAHLRSALTEAAKSVTASYADRVRLARENGGEVRPRTQIMRLLSGSNERSWSGSDIQRLWAENISHRDDYAFMHAALGQLLTEKYGEILKRTGKRQSYRYHFTDPHIRPYLRIVGVGN